MRRLIFGVNMFCFGWNFGLKYGVGLPLHFWAKSHEFIGYYRRPSYPSPLGSKYEFPSLVSSFLHGESPSLHRMLTHRQAPLLVFPLPTTTQQLTVLPRNPSPAMLHSCHRDAHLALEFVFVVFPLPLSRAASRVCVCGPALQHKQYQSSS